MSAPTPLVQSRSIGALKVHALQAGGQKLDGGAMFGVVPKPLWEKRISADERNRIPLGMRCLLIEHESGLVLIDTGAGNKENDKFKDIYGLENEGAGGLTALEDALATLSIAPEDIDVVINTHLHFDHGGGNTRIDSAGALGASFPSAKYYANQGEYGYAMHPNERTAASYFERNFVPLVESGAMQLVGESYEVVSGVTMFATPGHTPHHASIRIVSGGETAVYLGDVVPTHAHLPLPWIMGYDVEPLVTLESKRSLLSDAAAEGWTLIFEHDARVPWGRVEHDGRSYRLRPEDG